MKYYIGIDIGTSTIAIVSDNKVELKILAENIEINEKEKIRLQRKLEVWMEGNRSGKMDQRDGRSVCGIV